MVGSSGIVAVHCEDGDEFSGVIIWEISQPAEELLASQERLFSTGLIAYLCQANKNKCCLF
jgi:hypothetical protein